MTRFVGFLRAINVGGHTVKMQDLRQLVVAMGFADVETYIQTGNIIFEAADAPRVVEHTIAQALQQALGYEVATFVRALPELAAIAQHAPFPHVRADDSLYIAFLGDEPSEAARQKLLARNNEVDQFHIHNREVFWLCHKRLSESTFSGALLEKTLATPATIRNVTTVRKIAAKYPVPG